MATDPEAPDVETDEPQVDLNAASKEDLRTLSGIGAALAQRVIDYREAHAGFLAPEEITEVPGIGQRLYDRWRHRLMVGNRTDKQTDEDKRTTEATENMEGETEMNGKKDVSVVGMDVVVAEKQVDEEELEEEVKGEAAEAPEAEVEASKMGEPVSDVSESAYEEEMITEAETEEEEEPEIAQEPTDEATPFEPAELPEEEAVTEEEPETEPEPVAEAPKRGGIFWGWVLASLLGGILGMIFSLLVFAGINGTLDVNNSAAILDLQDRVDGLSTELAEQETAIDGVVERVSVLEDITPRVDEVETAVEGLKQDAQGLSERADTLSSEVDAVIEDLIRLEEDVTTSTTFLTRLQELLNELFGAESE